MSDGLHDRAAVAAVSESACETYDACFDQGHKLRLYDRPGTFRVSRAGLALGDYLVRNLCEAEIGGRILDIGTGSGAIALLLRKMGANSVAATDISAEAVATARQNELANFGDPTIDFWHGDLFPDAEPGQNRRFDLIVFNPPGWRAPSDLLKAELDEMHRSLDLEAMFYGDSVLLRFLQQLPEHLADNGRAIIGLNSLIGIADIFAASQTTHRPRGGSTLHARLLERIEFPLLFYSDEWLAVRRTLLAQFEEGRQEYAATYVTKGETIHWFYEITEVTVKKPPKGSAPSHSHDQASLGSRNAIGSSSPRSLPVVPVVTASGGTVRAVGGPQPLVS